MTNEDRMLDRIPGFNYDNSFYPLGGSGVGYPDQESDNSNSFQIATNNIYKANSFVFAVMDFRRSVFNQIDFVYKKRNVKAGERPRPGDVFDGPGLKILEEPWPGANTSDLLSRMINDVDLCGNSYVIRRSRDRLQRLSPDSVTVIFGSKMSTTNPRVMPDAEIIGYVYSPRESPEVEEYYLPEEMCHWAPLADPSLQSLGMTWLEPLMKDVDTDQSLQTHVIAYLRNGANPGTVLTFDPSVDEEKARRFLTQFQ